MLPGTVERLSRIDNIVGIKEATGDLDRAQEILAHCGPEFAVYSGDDPTAVGLMLLGGHGTVSVTANVVPAALAEIAAAALDGDAERARRLDAAIAELHHALFLEPNPIPVKWALAEMGLIGPELRLPMTPLEAGHHESLRRVLRDVGAIS
jgi:4-hydroxy-tetrahydrodipicolinate synthase